MENLKIEVEEDKTYWERMKSLLILGFPLIITFSIIVYFSPLPNRGSDLDALLRSVGICTLLSLTLFLFSDIVCAYHISFLEIKENRVHIIYKKRDKSFVLDDAIEKFEFSYRPGSLRSAFIKIEFNGAFVLRQHKVWNWKKEGVFDQTIKYLENRKLLVGTYSII